ncbi:hypothetical protein BEN71_06905 [Acinetobacter wuhouensis]|uniref:hypothetical protein n=1 Tax=Acinetobacter wuhouensis TaxID=1879050 RepID=UPI000E335B93|nr:hypothetical protein [Acinetobacter wuhouensis]AXQ21809.1 hypothetical protein BEN71_06905 [Acinetobacter wuhouensis]
MTNFFFGPQQAQQLIDTMRVIHGNLFTHQMGNVSPDQVETIIIGAMVGVSEAQFHFGLAQLSTQPYCPSIAQFRALCVSGSWWSIDEAWARVCEYTKDRKKNKITTLAKYAFDQVEYLINMGQMKEAQNQFKGIYNANLLKAQVSGKSQEFYKAPLQIGMKQIAEEKTTAQKVGLNEEQQLILTMTNRLREQGMTPKEAFVQAQIAIRGEVKKANKFEHAEHDLEMKSDSDYWPDPFDDFEKYKAALRAEQKPLPNAVRFLDEQVGGGV